MGFGDIILIPFPFAELTQVKARPSIVIAETADRYRDLVVAAISSVLPVTPSKNEFIIEPSKQNGLRVRSVVKVDRLVTTKRERLIAEMGSVSEEEKATLKRIFESLPIS
jgi:mRNA interferase MazF